VITLAPGCSPWRLRLELATSTAALTDDGAARRAARDIRRSASLSARVPSPRRAHITGMSECVMRQPPLRIRSRCVINLVWECAQPRCACGWPATRPCFEYLPFPCAREPQGHLYLHVVVPTDSSQVRVRSAVPHRISALAS